MSRYLNFKNKKDIILYYYNKKSPDVNTPIFVIIIDSPRLYSANHCYYWLYKDKWILGIDKFQLPDRKQQSTENIRKTWQIYHRRKRGLQRDKEIHNAEIAVYHEPGRRPGDKKQEPRRHGDLETRRLGDKK
jgi:hypothetical protein